MSWSFAVSISLFISHLFPAIVSTCVYICFPMYFLILFAESPWSPHLLHPRPVAMQSVFSQCNQRRTCTPLPPAASARCSTAKIGLSDSRGSKPWALARWTQSITIDAYGLWELMDDGPPKHDRFPKTTQLFQRFSRLTSWPSGLLHQEEGMLSHVPCTSANWYFQNLSVKQ